MKNGTRGVEVAVTILLAVAGAAVAMGVFSASEHHPASLWWASAAGCFIAAVLVAVVFFAIHPLFARGQKDRNASGAPGPAPMSTSELRHYLRSIKKTMEDEGFPLGTPQRQERLTSNDDDVEAARGVLVQRGHDLLTSLALNLEDGEVISGASPAVLAYVRDGQDFVSRHLPGRAQPELIRRYNTVGEAQRALDETLSAVRSVGQPAYQKSTVDQGRIVRANVQAVMDELAWAVRIINEALDERGFWWDSPLTWETWDNVKYGLRGEPGFHAAYNATRQAWDAVQRAEVNRLNYDPENDFHRGDFAPWDARHITDTLRQASEAEELLFKFLANSEP